MAKQEERKKRSLVLYANRVFEEVLDEAGNPRFDEDGNRIRKRVPGSELYIYQWVDENGEVSFYTAELVLAGKKFTTFLNKRDESIEALKRAIETADDETIEKIKQLLGV